MGLATVTKAEWGYEVTGDTDATPIYSGKLWVKRIGYSAASSGNATVLTSSSNLDPTSTQVSCGKFKAASGSELDSSKEFMYFGDKGVPFNNLTVTLGNGSDILYVYLKF